VEARRTIAYFFFNIEAFIVEGYFIGCSQESPFIFVFSLVRRVVSNFF